MARSRTGETPAAKRDAFVTALSHRFVAWLSMGRFHQLFMSLPFKTPLIES